MKSSKIFKAVIFDLDGVLWRGQTPLPGVSEVFTLLRDAEYALMLATNNATAAPEDLQNRMQAMGVHVDPDEIITSATATADFLADQYKEGTRVLPFGEKGLYTALEKAGFTLVEDPWKAEIVVTAMDRDLTWQKMNNIVLALLEGTPYYATNGDYTFPLEKGIGIGSGSFIASFEAATGTKATIIGKPEPGIFQIAQRRLNAEAQSILVLGDRLETDILGAQRADMKTGLMMTGVTTPEYRNASPIKADYVFEDLFAVCSFLSGEKS